MWRGSGALQPNQDVDTPPVSHGRAEGEAGRGARIEQAAKHMCLQIFPKQRLRGRVLTGLLENGPGNWGSVAKGA